MVAHPYVPATYVVQNNEDGHQWLKDRIRYAPYAYLKPGRTNGPTRRNTSAIAYMTPPHIPVTCAAFLHQNKYDRTIQIESSEI